MYKDVILKHSIEQAHTNTTHDSFCEILFFFRFETFWRSFLSEMFRKQNIVGWSKFKNLKNDVLEIALDQ